MATVEQSATEIARPSTQIWDPFVRLFHWTLVLLIAFSWWSGEHHDMERHRFSGYAILALLVFRFIWGFAGSRTARFGSFVRGPRAVVAYVRTLGHREIREADGHNPLGGWSVVAMLAVLIAMVTAGLFSVDVDGLESGPLADYVSFDAGRAAAGIHAIIFKAILALTALHVLAMGFYLLWKRRNLVWPMLTGRRILGDHETAQELRWSPIAALTCLATGIAAAWIISRGFRL